MPGLGLGELGAAGAFSAPARGVGGAVVLDGVVNRCPRAAQTHPRAGELPSGERAAHLLPGLANFTLCARADALLKLCGLGAFRHIVATGSEARGGCPRSVLTSS